MNRHHRHDPYRLAAQLAQTPGAVAVLVALQEHGGSAALERTGRQRGPRVNDPVRWLTAVGLVRRTGGAGTLDLDDQPATYELTALGAALTRSLTDLAARHANRATSHRRTTVTERRA